MKNLFTLLLTSWFLSFAPAVSFAGSSSGHNEPERQDWSFGGFTGAFDKQQLQRGFGVYKEVCASCHGLSFVAYRNLYEKGGPEFTKEQAKAIAGEVEIVDGVDDDGEPKKRKGILADRFKPPFANEQEARSANGGAYPPDLSLIVKGRTFHRELPWYKEPFYWIYDIVTAYEERGADYLYALLTGYGDAPSSMKMNDGMSYNKVFPGHQIAMPSPLSEGSVSYADGTRESVDQYARDVTAFLAWTSEPHLNARKSMGKLVLFYLFLFAGIVYLLKREVWKKIKH